MSRLIIAFFKSTPLSYSFILYTVPKVGGKYFLGINNFNGISPSDPEAGNQGEGQHPRASSETFRYTGRRIRVQLQYASVADPGGGEFFLLVSI